MVKNKRKTKEEKALDAATNELYRVHFNCVQVNMMDLGKIMDELRAIVGSLHIADKAQEIVARYRKN